MGFAYLFGVVWQLASGRPPDHTLCIRGLAFGVRCVFLSGQACGPAAERPQLAF